MSLNYKITAQTPSDVNIVCIAINFVVKFSYVYIYFVAKHLIDIVIKYSTTLWLHSNYKLKQKHLDVILKMMSSYVSVT